MSEKRYQIVFEGELVPGSQHEAVRRNLAQLFKMDESKVEGLLSGKRVVLKKEADQATAMKFRAAMKKAGAVCHLVSLDEPEEITPAPPPEPEPAQPSASAAPAADTAAQQPEPAANTATQTAADAGGGASATEAAGNMEMVGTIRTGGTDFSGPFDVAPAGTEIGEQRDLGPEQDPDISHLSMAEPGAELEELPRHEAVEAPDISHLSIEPAEGDR